MTIVNATVNTTSNTRSNTAPSYHWTFDQNNSASNTNQQTLDIQSNTAAKLNKAVLSPRNGAIGRSVHLKHQTAQVLLDFSPGELGASDFTIAFGMYIDKVVSPKHPNEIFGNRVFQGFMNYLSCRYHADGKLDFEICEDGERTGYTRLLTGKGVIQRKAWHHIALVRQQKTLKLFIDGKLLLSKTNSTAPVTLKHSQHPYRLGSGKFHTPIAFYEDLRIYRHALSDAAIAALLPVNTPLQPGQARLLESDRATLLITQPIHELKTATAFERLQLGPNTGVTLFSQPNFGGAAHKCFAELPNIKLSPVGHTLKAIQIWPAAHEPFQGYWHIKTANSRFVDRVGSRLTTNHRRKERALFQFHYNQQLQRVQLLVEREHESNALRPRNGQQPEPLFVVAAASHPDEFYITNLTEDRWLNEHVDWVDKPQRAVFARTTKLARHENQVGDLQPGEVAIYQHVGYAGKVWIFNDRSSDSDGHFPDLGLIDALDNQASSIRLGPNTAVTLFDQKNFDRSADPENDVEDITQHQPTLFKSQLGNDQLTGLQIFRTVAPEAHFDSISTLLSQDYHLVDGKLQEFSAYRTTVRCQPETTTIQVSATDTITIEIAGEQHQVDELTAVTVKPNAIGQVIITSVTSGLNTPALKLKTAAMADNEQVVIHPNRLVQARLANLNRGELWQAQDAKGNLIVDRDLHTEAEVANVENTIRRSMASLGQPASAPAYISAKRRLTVATDAEPFEPWILNFGSESTPTRTSSKRTRTSEQPLSQPEFEALRQQANPGSPVVPANPFKTAAPVNDPPSLQLAARGRLLRKLRSALKKATRVVVGFVKKVMHVIVDIAGELVEFVLDAAEKVLDFVEGVVEKVVKTIRQFIEFLQFLFDWGDFIETRDHLKVLVNYSLDRGFNMAQAAKPKVQAFFTDLATTIDTAFDQTIAMLGVAPQNVADTGTELPPALEWLLDKLFGRHGPNNTESGFNSGQAQLTSDTRLQTTLASCFENIKQALANVLGAGAAAVDGLFDTFMALISNPARPQRALAELLDTARDVILQLLAAGAAISHALVDAVSALVKVFKAAINQVIYIPLVSELMDFLGIGELSLINIMTLLVAIPTTVASKLIFGHKPWPSNDQQELTLALDRRLQPLQLEQSGEDTSAAPKPRSDNDSDSDRRLDRILGIAAIATGTIGAALDMILDAIALNEKSFEAAEWMSFGIATLNWLVSIPTLGSESFDRDNKLQIATTAVAAGFLIVDGVVLWKDKKRSRRDDAVISTGWALAALTEMGLNIAVIAKSDDDTDVKALSTAATCLGVLPAITAAALESKKSKLTIALHFGTAAVSLVTTPTLEGIALNRSLQITEPAPVPPPSLTKQRLQA